MKRIWLILFIISTVWGQGNERTIEKWDNGVVKIKHYYEGQGFDEELIGIKTYYRNGDLKWKSRYKNGKRHGEYSFHLPGSKLLLKGNFNNGDTYNTHWYAYHPVEMFSDRGPSLGFSSKLSGFDVDYYQADDVNVFVTFHDNGELSEYSVSHGLKVKHPDWGKNPNIDNNYYWYENGMIRKIAYYYGSPFKDNYGFRQKIWFDSGELQSEMEAQHKMTTTKFTTYYKNGNMKSTREVLKGTEIYSLHYDQYGNVKY